MLLRKTETAERTALIAEVGLILILIKKENGHTNKTKPRFSKYTDTQKQQIKVNDKIANG